MSPRPGFVLRYADGGTLTLGERTRVMGILNVTPDSFSDGGRVRDSAQAASIALDMVASGAEIVDVGGESTRPGADEVPVAEELERVLPVIEAIRQQAERQGTSTEGSPGPSPAGPSVRISIDTRRAEVARRALESGADMINDVSGAADPDMLPLARETGAPLVLMHMRGSPETMQRNTRYRDLLGEIRGYLAERIEKAAEAGLGDDKIVVDPGVGFGKSLQGNLRILKHLETFRQLGRSLLVGASRKTFIGTLLDAPVDDRLEGSLAVAGLAAWNGAHLVRVHDVRATVRTVRMIDAVRTASAGS